MSRFRARSEPAAPTPVRTTPLPVAATPRQPVRVAVPVAEAPPETGAQAVGSEPAPAEDPSLPTAEQRAFYEQFGQDVAEAEYYCGTAPVGLACAGDVCSYVGQREPPWMSGFRRPMLVVERAVSWGLDLPIGSDPCGRAGELLLPDDMFNVAEGMCFSLHRPPNAPTELTPAKRRARLDSAKLACAAAAADLHTEP